MVSANWHCAGILGEVRKFAAIDVHAYCEHASCHITDSKSALTSCFLNHPHSGI